MDCKKRDFELEFMDIENEYGEVERFYITALYEVGNHQYLSLVSGVEKSESSDGWVGHLYQYLDMEGDFELMEIESDDEFNEVAAVIQAFEDKCNA